MPKKPIIVMLVAVLVPLLAYAQDVNLQLISAARQGESDTVRSLLEAGADPNATDLYDVTPLMRAAYGGHVDTVKVLLNAGADVFAKSVNGMNIFDWATRGESSKVLSLLRKHASDEVKSQKKELEKDLKSKKYTWAQLIDWKNDLRHISVGLKTSNVKKLEKKIKEKRQQLVWWNSLYQNWYKQCEYSLTRFNVTGIQSQFDTWINYVESEFPSISKDTLNKVAQGTGSCLCPPYPTFTRKGTSTWESILAAIVMGLEAYGEANQPIYESYRVDGPNSLQIGRGGGVYDQNGNPMGSLRYSNVRVRGGKVYDRHGNYLGRLNGRLP